MRYLLLLIPVILCQYGGAGMKGEFDNDWPMERHDPQMTGHTHLKGEMLKAPEVIWKHYLGLWSNHLMVTASPDSSETIPLPEKPFGEGYFWENSLEWGLRQRSVDIDGKGKLVDRPGQCSVKLAKLLPEVPGYQRVEFDNAFSGSMPTMKTSRAWSG